VIRPDDAAIRAWAEASGSRMEFWPRFVAETRAAVVAEIGVYRGGFAARLLDECPGIATYYMIDPWRHLDDWNKPANKGDDVFERYLEQTLKKTDAWSEKRVVLRGRTTEVIGDVPDGSLDLAYIDGDHTLRGITVDLIKVFPKVRAGGWIGGDDLSPSIWQHDAAYEPTLVFPFAVHFAEAVDARIYALPHKQFLIEKADTGFELIDLTGRYGSLGLRDQLMAQPREAPAEPAGVVARWRRRRRPAP
jgi:hypothetical protein